MKKLLWGGVLLCLLSLLVYSLTGPKTLIVPDRYSTIQKAIDAADSGDTVEIKPGLYQESLRFKDNITLTGTDREKVVLMFDTRKTPVLSAFNSRGTLSNLTFKSLGINPSPEMEKNQPLLKLVHSTLKVDHCVLEDSCGNGINIELASQCEMAHCLIQNNRRSGIVVLGNRTSANLHDNRCLRNGMNGLGFGSGATGIVKANECRDNTGSGLYFENEKLVQVDNNICQNNGEINYGYLRYLLLQENFTELETIAAQLRTKKSRFRSGEWQLFFYYIDLTKDWGTPSPSQPIQAEQILEKWRKAKPDSITPVILLAEFYCDQAWLARSCNWASEVTPEGWQGFEKYLKKSWALLSAAENEKKINDPMFYHAALTTRVLGMGQIDEMEGLFSKGIALEPTFYPLYYIKQLILLPRWYGQPGQVEAFVDQAVKDNFKTEGDSLYARMTTELLANIGCKGIKELGFDYPRIKRSHEDLLKRYPDINYFLNSFCLFAGTYRDREQTRRLIEKIGDNWNKSIWKEEKYYEGYRRWATVQTVPILIAAPTTQSWKP
jgi:hypothetical protein